jgi:hypothetical protein
LPVGSPLAVGDIKISCGIGRVGVSVNIMTGVDNMIAGAGNVGSKVIVVKAVGAKTCCGVVS